MRNFINELTKCQSQNDSRAAAQVHRSLYSHAYRRAHQPLCHTNLKKDHIFDQERKQEHFSMRERGHSNWNMEDGDEQIRVKQTFCGV